MVSTFFSSAVIHFIPLLFQASKQAKLVFYPNFGEKRRGEEKDWMFHDNYAPRNLLSLPLTAQASHRRLVLFSSLEAKGRRRRRSCICVCVCVFVCEFVCEFFGFTWPCSVSTDMRPWLTIHDAKLSAKLADACRIEADSLIGPRGCYEAHVHWSLSDLPLRSLLTRSNQDHSLQRGREQNFIAANLDHTLKQVCSSSGVKLSSPEMCFDILNLHLNKIMKFQRKITDG